MSSLQIETLSVKSLRRSSKLSKKVTQELLSWSIELLGNREILNNSILGLYAPIRCNGDLILKSIEMARYLRDQRITVLSRFQSPIELEFWYFLLKGSQPIAKILDSNTSIVDIDKDQRKLIEENRLLLIKPKFPVASSKEQLGVAAIDILKLLSDSLMITHFDKTDSPVTADEIESDKFMAVYSLESESANAGIQNINSKSAKKILSNSYTFIEGKSKAR